MVEYIEIVVGLIAIVTFLCTIINYTIIKPQRLYVDNFVAAVNELKDVVKQLDSVVTEIRERVVTGEVHIDDLLERVNTLEEYHKQPPMMGARRK